MRYGYLYLLLFCLLFSCSSPKEEADSLSPQEIKKFNGNYGKTFDDLHEVQIVAAQKNGIAPMTTRDDTLKIKDKLVRIPKELAYYKVDKLKHSVPYLVPKASDLLLKISINFRDSLNSKKLPIYKPIITSLTRTEEDVKSLTKRNGNASQKSTHCYGTTFDISWRRFEKQNPYGKELSSDKLKLVLGEVLSDLKQLDMCYVKHERKQACFHITVR
ncbi:DUF5715 family protein [Viscerimonas tarda]